MICQKCGKVLPDGMKFCGYCGAPQQAAGNGSGAAAGKILCNVCGAECDSDMVYCNCCGSKLIKETPQRVQPRVDQAASVNNLTLNISQNKVVMSEEATPNSEFELRNKGDDYIIAKYLGNRKHVVIPSHIWGRKVVEIGDGAFGGKLGGLTWIGASGVESVVIPETVSIIGKGAFKSCMYLTDVKMHSGIKEIRREAFFDCSNISTLNFGEEVSVNKRVHFPRGLDFIGLGAFSKEGMFRVKCYLQEVTLDKHTKVENGMMCETFHPRDVAVFYYND